MPQEKSMSVEKQTAIIYCGTKGLLREVPMNKVKEFEADFLTLLEAKHKNVLGDLRAGKLTDEITGTLEKIAQEVSAKYKK